MVATEREVLQLTKDGKSTVDPIRNSATPENVKARYQHLNKGLGLNENQITAMVGLLHSADKITGLQGSAGTGKTTNTLVVVTEYAKSKGFEVIGLAPTGRARKELAQAGIPAQTLQRFLLKSSSPKKDQEVAPRLLIVDESSLVSTKQFRDLLKRLGPQDRVIEVGDIRQHESVEAARIFHEQQLGGMRTETLTKIVRQQSPEMVSVVELLQQGRASSAIRMLGVQGKVDVIERRKDRLLRIAAAYAESPQQGTLVISPDNRSRKELNKLIREELQGRGDLGPNVAAVTILTARQDLTKEDRRLAASYDPGTVVQFHAASKALGVEANDRATVIARNSQENTVTVQTEKRTVTYNPKEHFGVEIFEPELRDMAQGDHIVFRKGWKDKAIVTGDRAQVESIDAKGNVKVSLEERGRTVVFNVRDMPHLDDAYTSTSYSAQGATADRVLVHMETSGKGAKQLLTAAMAYVSLSRPRHEMRAFTDDLVRLERLLEHSEEKRTALAPKQVAAYGFTK